MSLDKLFELLELYLWRKWREHAQANAETLTFNELDYLEFIDSHEALRLTDLANGLGITKASASAMISKLENRGLIIRSNNINDARASNLELSATGRALRDQANLLYRDLSNLVKKSMNYEDFTQLEILLEQTCQILKNQD